MILQNNGYPVRIPEKPARYRANCSKDWGVFVSGNTDGMNVMKASQAGLCCGSVVEMALCWNERRVLTFEPHYINEEFLEVWGIPVTGEMKTKFHEKASELSTFMLHRQSKDKFSELLETFSRDAFNEWVDAGMEGDPNDFTLAKLSEVYAGKIFRFEMKSVEGEYGLYHFVETSYRDPETDLEKAALLTAKMIFEAQRDGQADYCVDYRLVQNEADSLEKANSLAALPPSSTPVADIAKAGNKTKVKA
jgi:hypothetical protein